MVLYFIFRLTSFGSNLSLFSRLSVFLSSIFSLSVLTLPHVPMLFYVRCRCRALQVTKMQYRHSTWMNNAVLMGHVGEYSTYKCDLHTESRKKVFIVCTTHATLTFARLLYLQLVCNLPDFIHIILGSYKD